jgi:hypothetical protein
MPSETPASPRAPTPAVEAESRGDPWVETGESRT